MYLVSASSTHYCSWETPSKFFDRLSHLYFFQLSLDTQMGGNKVITVNKAKNRVLTESDMKARSGSSTMGDKVPS